jgi:putative aldouronate transport system substrate-binding protein
MKGNQTGKFVSLIVVTATLAVLIGGCGTDEKPASTIKTSEAPKGPVEIEWLAYDSYGQPDENSVVVKAVEEKFNAKFKFWYLDAQKWSDQLNVKLAAGEMPDFLKVTSDLPKLVNDGVLAPFSEEQVRKLAPTYSKLLDKYPEAWNVGRYDGKLYTLPTINVNADYATSLIWRKDWLDNVGIMKVPETLQEVEDALIKFRNNDPDKNGKKDTYGMSDFALTAILGAYGNPAFNSWMDLTKANNQVLYMIKDNKVSITSIQPEMKEALATLAKWYRMELIDPEFLTGENTGGYWADSQSFYNGKIGLTGKGMYYQWRNEINPNLPDDAGGAQYQNFKKSQPKGEIIFGKAPVGPSGKSGTEQWSAFLNPKGMTVKAAKDTVKVETFLKMVEAATSDYNYFMLVGSGVQGTDWKLNDKGDFVNLNTSLKTAELNQKGIGVLNGVSNPDFQKNINPFQYSFAEKVKVNGYAPPVVPSVDSFQKNLTNLAKLTTDYYVRMITGEYPIDKFDEFVTKFKASGGDQIEKDVNEAYKKMLGK